MGMSYTRPCRIARRLSLRFMTRSARRIGSEGQIARGTWGGEFNLTVSRCCSVKIQDEQAFKRKRLLSANRYEYRAYRPLITADSSGETFLMALLGEFSGRK